VRQAVKTENQREFFWRVKKSEKVRSQKDTVENNQKNPGSRKNSQNVKKTYRKKKARASISN